MLFPRYLIVIMLLMLAGCDDLNPSADDIRPPANCDVIGPEVCQMAPVVSLPDTLGITVTIPDVMLGTNTDGIVLYFTMWCSTCSSHISEIVNGILPNYPNVKLFIIDYVSGTIESSYEAQKANGFTELNVLVDIDREAVRRYEGNMATTVVIENTGSHGTIRMNELYKPTKLTETLDALP